MPKRFDVAILGAGPAGEHAANALVDAGKRVLLIERELIGGECTNWACIPSKTLLRPTEVRSESARAAGTETAGLDWPALARYRDYMTSAGDDSGRIKGYVDRGVEVVKADGRLAGPGRLQVGDEEYEADAILISTGSDPVIPPIDGLQETGYWTNRDATSLSEIPASVVIVGGGPVGVELGQFLRRFGSRVAVVEGADRLAEREDEHVGELLRAALGDDGIEVHTGVRAHRVTLEGDERVVVLSDGTQLRGERLLLATGRRPRGVDIGLETIGVEPGRHGEVPVNEHCRVAEGVWAAGDCTGAMLFTHVAKYQARVAMADMRGRPVAADYRAIPRVIFTDPEVAAVGLTEAQAREAGHDVATAQIDLPSSISRPYTYEQNPRGELGVVVDRSEQVMLGAWAVAPLASEWIHQAVLAIKARIPVDVVVQTVAQFPSYSEAFLSVLQQLEL
jgi:pyruvate/2-oxoglutarate dehydrogenase complex dihydrolipoamide dehydrogenase (E3) component